MENIVAYTRAILNTDIEYGDIQLKARYTSLESVREPLLTKRCELQRDLAIAREKVRTPPHHPVLDKTEPRLTDFDRNTMQSGAVAELNYEYELVKGLEELVKDRIEFVRSLLYGN